MIECDTFVMNAAFFTADTQGGDDIIGSAQRLMGVAAQAEPDVAADTLEDTLCDGAVDRQFLSIGIHKHHFGDADAVGVIGNGLGQER